MTEEDTQQNPAAVSEPDTTSASSAEAVFVVGDRIEFGFDDDTGHAALIVAVPDGDNDVAVSVTLTPRDVTDLIEELNIVRATQREWAGEPDPDDGRWRWANVAAGRRGPDPAGITSLPLSNYAWIIVAVLVFAVITTFAL